MAFISRRVNWECPVSLFCMVAREIPICCARSCCVQRCFLSSINRFGNTGFHLLQKLVYRATVKFGNVRQLFGAGCVCACFPKVNCSVRHIQRFHYLLDRKPGFFPQHFVLRVFLH
nr:MAG TPA: hypothetical protein [Caudoviricetes sp.]